MKSIFSKFLSYFIPITILKRKSQWSDDLELTWNNGELVINSSNLNYSYGTSQRILKKGLLTIGYEKIARMKNILVLGVAGGCVIKTLIDEVHYTDQITGIEIDPVVADLANDYYQLNKIPNLKIIIDDAFDFVLKTKEKYDMVIIDIFQDKFMPKFLFESPFAKNIGTLIDNGGVALFNTMLLNDDDKNRNRNFVKELGVLNFKTKIVSKVEHYNELILFANA